MIRAHEARTIGRFVNAFKKANRRVSNRVGARWGKMMNLARSRLRRTGRNMIHAAARAGNSIRCVKMCLMATKNKFLVSMAAKKGLISFTSQNDYGVS